MRVYEGRETRASGPGDLDWQRYYGAVSKAILRVVLAQATELCVLRNRCDCRRPHQANFMGMPYHGVREQLDRCFFRETIND